MRTKRSWTMWVLVLSIAASTTTLMTTPITMAKKKTVDPTTLYKGKSPAEAAEALLTLAEEKAGNGSWELIGVGRAWYLGGDKARGQALFDRVTGHKPEASDWFRIARVYLEAGEKEKAWNAFETAVAMAPKDDSGMLEVGAHLNVSGNREAAEEHFDRGFAKSPNEFWHFVVSGGSYLGVNPD